MKISRVQIQNFRSIKSLDLPVDSYTALVGANGSGKSSVLYALDWFFTGGPLELSDVHGHTLTEITDDTMPAAVVEVTVTFSGLTNRDRERLEQYGRGDTASFKRAWEVGADKDKVVGNALQGPGFAAIRGMKLVGEFRPAYNVLRESVTDLPVLTNPTKDQVIAAFVDWESRAENAAQLEVIASDDASHMFGIGGSHIIKQCVRMVLVPAATDISGEVGGIKKGSALGELIGTLMSNAGVEAKQAWIARNETVISELTESMLTSVEASTGLQSQRINERLAHLIPNAQIAFKADVPSWVPSPVATVQTDVSIDGAVNDVSRQGHGIQRAVMIAMFQSLVPDAKLAEGDHERLDGESDEDAQLRLDEALLDLPNLLICIEEPEIYQHPVRARAFARVLSELAEQDNAQVLIATHSPYFARPSQFAGIRRFTLDSGESRVTNTTVDEVAVAASTASDHVEKIVQKRLPTTFSEGFFADVVVLVEGDTDRAVLDALSEKQNRPFDAAGISVQDMAGKGGLAIPNAMLTKLDIPTYVIADADALGAHRKHAADAIKEAEAHASHQRATNELLTWLPTSAAVLGTLPFAFGDSTIVCAHYTIWNDDIEAELANWPSFVTALAANGHSLRDKDLLAYRTAVIEADLADLPDSLDKAVGAIHAFRESH